jgi:hypothetical protein
MVVKILLVRCTVFWYKLGSVKECVFARPACRVFCCRRRVMFHAGSYAWGGQAAASHVQSILETRSKLSCAESKGFPDFPVISTVLFRFPLVFQCVRPRGLYFSCSLQGAPGRPPEARGPSAGGGGAYRSFFLCSPHERRAIMREVPVWLPLYPSTKKTSMPGNSPRTTGWFDRDQIYFAASAVPHGYASFE